MAKTHQILSHQNVSCNFPKPLSVVLIWIDHKQIFESLFLFQIIVVVLRFVVKHPASWDITITVNHITSYSTTQTSNNLLPVLSAPSTAAIQDPLGKMPISYFNVLSFQKKKFSRYNRLEFRFCDLERSFFAKFKNSTCTQPWNSNGSNWK